MASCLFLSYVLFLYNTVSSAGDTVFVQTGASVQLNIQREKIPDEFDFISWKDEKSDYVVKYFNESKKVKPYSSYINRVDFNIKTFSLTLKNMQKTDSGIYTAIASSQSDINISEHKVSVRDAVEAPVLTVNSVWSSTEPCNFTCKTDIITITSTDYNRSGCSDEVKSSEIYNLTLKCIDDIIICNYSNPVSWKNYTKTLQQLCTAEKNPAQWIIPLICIFPLFLVAIFCFQKRKDAEQREESIYAEVEENNKEQKRLEMKAGDAEKELDVINETNQSTPDSKTQNAPVEEKSKPFKSTFSSVQQQPMPSTSETDQTLYAVVNKPLR